MIIGITGNARSGKDTFATMLTEEYSWWPHVTSRSPGRSRPTCAKCSTGPESTRTGTSKTSQTLATRVSPPNHGTLDDLRKVAAITADCIRDVGGTDDAGEIDPRLVPGCWVRSWRFGECVLSRIENGVCYLRYKAAHLATGKTIWVAIGDDKVKFLRPPNDLSKVVLTLEGPYGLGFDKSDPRM